MSENVAPHPSCPKCGAPLAAGTVEGLCPACLLALNLATQTAWTGEVGPTGTTVVKPPPAPTLSCAEIGRHFPQLEILECLGRGGMGVVYRARQPRLNRFVALKILAPEREKDPAFAGRFEKEAQALARLNHPNIVTVHDFGETDGMYYLLMEFVDGVNLRQLLRAGRYSPKEALVIVPAICDALQYAHDQGIVHRDIKPENILLDKQGSVKIADFGIAKMVGGGGAAASSPPSPFTNREAAAGMPPLPSHTADHATAGTPGYMSPEQVATPKEVDHRADIYSLGVVLYEMLTGELPVGKFQPPSHRVLVDVRIDEIVLRALEQEPERRYQTASEFATQVETIVNSPRPMPVPVKIGWFGRIALAVGAACGSFLIIFLLVPQWTRLSNLLPKTYYGEVRAYVPTETANDPHFLRNSREAIVSKAVLDRVISDLELATQPEYGGNVASTNEAYRKLKARLEVRQYRDTSLLEIRYAAPTPQEAANVVNKIAELYRQWASRKGAGIMYEGEPPYLRKSKLPLIGTSMLSLLAGVLIFWVTWVTRPGKPSGVKSLAPIPPAGNNGCEVVSSVRSKVGGQKPVPIASPRPSPRFPRPAMRIVLVVAVCILPFGAWLGRWMERATRPAQLTTENRSEVDWVQTLSWHNHESLPPTATNHFTVPLPGGDLEVLAVSGSSVDAKGLVCWLLDGTVRCNPTNKPSAIVGRQDGKRMLSLLLPDPTGDMPILPFALSIDGRSVVSLHWSITFGKKGRLGFISFSAPRTGRQLDFRVGVPSGDWQDTDTRWKWDFHFGEERQSRERILVCEGQLVRTQLEMVKNRNGHVNAVFSPPRLPVGWMTRLVAVDDAGAEHTQFIESSELGGIPYDINDQFNGWFHNDFITLPFERLREFRIQIRPYRWAEFRNIALVAGQKGKVEAIGAAKAFTTPSSVIQ